MSLSFVHDAVVEKNAGFPVAYATPSEGTGYEIGSMSIIRGARNLAQARAFYDWALTPEAQKLGFDVGKIQRQDKESGTDAQGTVIDQAPVKSQKAANNSDIIIVVAKPDARHHPRRVAHKQRVAGLLGISPVNVALTAHTGEGLTAFGKGEGISATVIVTAVGA